MKRGIIVIKIQELNLEILLLMIITSIIKENILFFDSLSKISTIYVLGHSLSEIDIDYFEKIKSIVLSNAYWHISYYNENDKNNRVIPFW